MTYLQRVENLIVTILTNKLLDNITAKCQTLFRQFYGNQFIDLKKLMIGKIKLLLCEVE
ncbi:hypothetical protein LOAG_11968 [Loa loa]|uniref:Uncharacterized protein n=1 Tax=Loa loa TaxID=7209 RepID=A0A1S0TM31_LOALO|nr:hypothetical protein LOAG_11968 [Loa loa]EFO16539.1 hypothetical protein LOAG_11968 [Loa loa]